MESLKVTNGRYGKPTDSIMVGFGLTKFALGNIHESEITKP
jgi:hypothetical protein